MNASTKGTPIVNSNRMKSILSEAAASGPTPPHDNANRQGRKEIDRKTCRNIFNKSESLEFFEFSEGKKKASRLVLFISMLLSQYIHRLRWPVLVLIVHFTSLDLSTAG